MKIEFEFPDDLKHVQVSVLKTNKGALQCHAYAQDWKLIMRGGAFTFDPQSAVDSAVSVLREAQKLPEAPPNPKLEGLKATGLSLNMQALLGGLKK